MADKEKHTTIRQYILQRTTPDKKRTLIVEAMVDTGISDANNPPVLVNSQTMSQGHTKEKSARLVIGHQLLLDQGKQMRGDKKENLLLHKKFNAIN